MAYTYRTDKEFCEIVVYTGVVFCVCIQVLIETLVALGAQVRWSACNIYSTQVESILLPSSFTTVLMKNVFQWAGMLLIQCAASLSQSLSFNVYLFQIWMDVDFQPDAGFRYLVSGIQIFSGCDVYDAYGNVCMWKLYDSLRNLNTKQLANEVSCEIDLSDVYDIYICITIHSMANAK